MIVALGSEGERGFRRVSSAAVETRAGERATADDDDNSSMIPGRRPYP
jgi:hypothetical protein